jgi:hypothetical protein
VITQARLDQLEAILEARVARRWAERQWLRGLLPKGR